MKKNMLLFYVIFWLQISFLSEANEAKEHPEKSLSELINDINLIKETNFILVRLKEIILN